MAKTFFSIPRSNPGPKSKVPMKSPKASPSRLEMGPTSSTIEVKSPGSNGHQDREVTLLRTQIETHAQPMLNAAKNGKNVEVPGGDPHNTLEDVAKGKPLRTSAEISSTEKNILNEPGHAQKVLENVPDHTVKKPAENTTTQAESVAEPIKLKTAYELAQEGKSPVKRESPAVEKPDSATAAPAKAEEMDLEEAIASIHQTEVESQPQTPTPTYASITKGLSEAETPVQTQPTPDTNTRTAPNPDQQEANQEWQDPLNTQENQLLRQVLGGVADRLIQEMSKQGGKLNPVTFAEVITAMNRRGEIGNIFTVGSLRDLQAKNLLPVNDQINAIIQKMADALPNGAQPLLEQAVSQGLLNETDAQTFNTPQPDYAGLTKQLLEKKAGSFKGKVKKINQANIDAVSSLVTGKRTLFDAETLLASGIAETPAEARQLETYFEQASEDTRSFLGRTLETLDMAKGKGLKSLMILMMVLSLIPQLSGEQQMSN